VKRKNADMLKRQQRLSIKREVDFEDGREYVWWTVRDSETGYNKTFRTEEEAREYANELPL
jgi:hypothetical protein